MLDQKQFISAITQIAEEKGVPKARVIDVIEMALAAAYKKDYGKRGQMVRVELDEKTGNTKFFQLKVIVDESILREEEEQSGDERKKEEASLVTGLINEEGGDKKIKFNPEKHIMLKEAKELLTEDKAILVKRAPDIEGEEDKIRALKITERFQGKEAIKKIELYDYLEQSVESHDVYGRIAAQTAKQVIMQRIREVEREAVYNEYKGREGEVVSGIIQRMERGNVFIDLGKTTGIMFFSEQIPGERYHIGQRVRAYIIKVEYDLKGSLVVLSRVCSEMVIKLFGFEVPEIEAGTVEIKAISREAGFRSKVAVFSNSEGVDPVGSCVGQKGTRVATIINELGGEKIDIIEWDNDEAKFIANALAPAKVLDVKLFDQKREARVKVDDDQLSLAIGKGGQNVRLAAKLTGWKIDIISGGKKEALEEPVGNDKGVEGDTKTVKKEKKAKKKPSTVKASKKKSKTDKKIEELEEKKEIPEARQDNKKDEKKDGQDQKGDIKNS